MNASHVHLVPKQRSLQHARASHAHLLFMTQSTLSPVSGPYGEVPLTYDPLLGAPLLQQWATTLVTVVARQPLAGVDETLPALPPIPTAFLARVHHRDG